LSGTADLTIGAALTANTSSIASFSVTQSGGFCGVCTPISVNFTGAYFDALTFGLSGTITGDFTGQNGGYHTFELILANIGTNGTGNWTFDDHKPSGLLESVGTYTPLVQTVDEPSAMLLLALGLAGLAASRRRKQ